MTKIGEPAPPFSLDSSGGGRVSLSDYAGKKIVLYFYPKDDTPGCTKEACDFRDSDAAFTAQGAVILGISPDPISSHDEFKAKYHLPFLLLSDPDHAVAEAYGVWKEKTLYGRTFMGIERSTFVVDEHGSVLAVFNRVQVDGHADHVLAVLKGEQPAPVPVEAPPPKSTARAVGAEPAAVAVRAAATAYAKKPAGKKSTGKKPEVKATAKRSTAGHTGDKFIAAASSWTEPKSAKKAVPSKKVATDKKVAKKTAPGKAIGAKAANAAKAWSASGSKKVAAKKSAVPSKKPAKKAAKVASKSGTKSAVKTASAKKKKR